MHNGHTEQRCDVVNRILFTVETNRLESVSERIKRMVEKNVKKNTFNHVFGVDASLVFFVFVLMRWFCAMAESMYVHNVHCIRCRLNIVMINNEINISFFILSCWMVWSHRIDGASYLLVFQATNISINPFQENHNINAHASPQSCTPFNSQHEN